MDKSTIIFDGKCLICNSFIRTPIKYAPKRFHFVSSHSSYGKVLLKKHQLSLEENLDTIYIIENHTVYDKSDAIAHILKKCGFVYHLLALLLIAIPKTLRDWAYKEISKRRHKIKSNTCEIPSNMSDVKIYY